MKISKKRFLLVAIIAIIAIVAIIVVSNNVKQKKIKNEITTGYSEIMDVVLTEYLTGTGTDRWGNPRKNEYAIKTGLEEINYKIVNITTEEGLYRGSHDDRYVLDVEIKLVCKSSKSVDMLDLAEEVFRTFNDIQGIMDDRKIGGYECSYHPTEDPNYAYEDLITIYVNGNKILSPYRHEQSDDKDTDSSVKCRRSGCGKKPIYTDWERRFCSEHINDTHYCRYPGCTNKVSNSSQNQYCYEHKYK